MGERLRWLDVQKKKVGRRLQMHAICKCVSSDFNKKLVDDDLRGKKILGEAEQSWGDNILIHVAGLLWEIFGGELIQD